LRERPQRRQLAQEQAKAFVLLRGSIDVGLSAKSEIEEDAFEFV